DHNIRLTRTMPNARANAKMRRGYHWAFDPFPGIRRLEIIVVYISRLPIDMNKGLEGPYTLCRVTGARELPGLEELAGLVRKTGNHTRKEVRLSAFSLLRD